MRAWAWGAARGLDYLEMLPEVDAKYFIQWADKLMGRGAGR